VPFFDASRSAISSQPLIAEIRRRRWFAYYADEGLEAKVQLMPSNTEIIEAIQRGDLQVGAAPVTTAIAAIAE
jgi:hypothetical protein